MDGYLTELCLWLIRLIATTSILGITALFLLYKYYTWHFDFFKSRGVPGPAPRVFFGTSLLFVEGFHEKQIELVGTYGKVFGLFEGRYPIYWISDPNIIKKIMVKEFSTFVNRRDVLFRGSFENNDVFDSKSDDWRRQRQLLTPVFTSGKMRQMSCLINEATDDLMVNMDTFAEKEEMIDAKEMFAAYVMDVITSVAFGMKANSQKNKDDPLVTAAKEVSKIDIANPLVFVAGFLPELKYILAPFNLTMYPKWSFRYMKKVINNAIAMRKDNPNYKTVDFLKLMIDAHKSEVGEQPGLSDDEIFGNSIVFLSAGYETTAGTMAWLLMNLALNPDVQEKLFAEIDEVMELHATPSYDSVQKMPYLDMCIDETLRKFSPAPMIERKASQDITIDGVFIKKGMLIQVPIHALHHDPDVWDDPMEFRPERFTPEAKAGRDPYVYMPFGQGPRNCLGMRLAQMEMKMALTRVLHRFRFIAPDSLRIPIRLKVGLFPVPEDGFNIRVERR